MNRSSQRDSRDICTDYDGGGKFDSMHVQGRRTSCDGAQQPGWRSRR